MFKAKLRNIEVFLGNHISEESSVVLGLSGGPDSMFLLHLLLQFQRKINFKLHVAHVDHNWRESSAKEAKWLSEYLKAYNCEFHLVVLDSGDFASQRNIEDKAREKRLEFFYRVYQKTNSNTLFLGHHLEDLSETVLKRVLEGAFITNLGGFSGVSVVNQMNIIRPLLEFTKEEILQYLQKENIPYFLDPTNLSQALLRGRQRTIITPFLEKNFGKNFSKNMKILSERSYELKSYLEKQTRKFEAKIDHYGSALVIDFSSFQDLEPLEVRFFLKKLLSRFVSDFSSKTLESVMNAILASKASKIFVAKGIELRAHLGKLEIDLSNLEKTITK